MMTYGGGYRDERLGSVCASRLGDGLLLGAAWHWRRRRLCAGAGDRLADGRGDRFATDQDRDRDLLDAGDSDRAGGGTDACLARRGGLAALGDDGAGDRRGWDP